jgi:hypothetical protein
MSKEKKMAKAKNSDDINEIIAEQLDKLSSGRATADDYKKADVIAKLLGKQLKKDGLRLLYFEKQKKTPPVIATFEDRNTEKILSQKGGKNT